MKHMNLKKAIIQRVSIIMIFTFIFCIVGMQTSEVYAATYSKSLTKTVTLKSGETLTWILASKGKGEVPLTYEIISLKDVKADEGITMNFVDC